PQIEWVDGRRLIARGVELTRGGVGISPASRRDWWLIEPAGANHNLTSQVEEPPSALWRESGRPSYLGLVNGEILRVDLRSRAITSLTQNFESRVSRVIWPTQASSGPKTVKNKEMTGIVLDVEGDLKKESYFLNQKNGHIDRKSRLN